MNIRKTPDRLEFRALSDSIPILSQNKAYNYMGQRKMERLDKLSMALIRIGFPEFCGYQLGMESRSLQPSGGLIFKQPFRWKYPNNILLLFCDFANAIISSTAPKAFTSLWQAFSFIPQPQTTGTFALSAIKVYGLVILPFLFMIIRNSVPCFISIKWTGVLGNGQWVTFCGAITTHKLCSSTGWHEHVL